MKIVLHLGAHCTEEGKLARALARNRDDLLARGVSVPPPGKYRVLLREAIHALDRVDPSDEAGDVLLDAILDSDEAEHVILSNENFFGVPHMSIGKGQFYPLAEQRLADLRQLFPDCRIELFLAIRDPGTFIPAVHAASAGTSLEKVLGGTDPGTLRWSDLVRRIRVIAPDMPLTVWCSEDSPLIFGEIVRAMAGLPEGQKIRGAFDLLSEIMSREGMKRFRAYFAANPTMTEAQKRKAILAFLDKYAIEDALEEDIEMPPWPQEVFEYLTDAYEEDLAEIEGQDGVRVLRP
ncbi:hypothetical protein OB2597_05740 [Pseudooceanicola batsensis HTCC2597]|uniref:Uncharacterized protein n=1 Tax=Pseudooceanicola batsensis (strain ATCC BAA-863 / DSM 15984 / KCTC 12145 / HTCC2597) TaxID=252305 RepID=A3TSY3_PSEBH|nr:hypothetical protein [Pseudooceanicola batsensis]EAQ04760.1 hypothetical protein OB2597_05740 [Pseudooceanicola batsensis HTCC2597]